MWWLAGLIALLASNGGAPYRTTRQEPADVDEQVGERNRRPSRRLLYRSRDGSECFRFRFTLHDNGIRIGIVEYPNPDIGSCHVFCDDDEDFVCWSEPIRTMAAAKRVAAMWAEATLLYQRSGRVF